MSKILILEDQALIALFIQNALESNGYETVVCNTPKEVFQIKDFSQFDFCLFDINLSDELDGVQVYKRLLSKHLIKVIFLTGFNDAYIEDKMKNVTPLGIIRKPVNSNILINCINNVLTETSEIRKLKFLSK